MATAEKPELPKLIENSKAGGDKPRPCKLFHTRDEALDLVCELNKTADGWLYAVVKTECYFYLPNGMWNFCDGWKIRITEFDAGKEYHIAYLGEDLTIYDMAMGHGEVVS